MFARTLSVVQPLVLLLARLAIGAIFIAHGWQKVTHGIGGTAKGFRELGVPLPELSALAAIVIELGGGIALVLGALLPLAGTFLALQMFGAFWFVHRGNGLWANEGGYEYVLALGAAALAIGFTGGGALAVDGLLARYRDRHRARTADAEGADAGTSRV